MAEQGFIAVAPDLFWRQEPGVDLSVASEPDWQHGLRLYHAYDRDVGVGDVKDTIHAAAKLPGWPTGQTLKSDPKKGMETYYAGSSRTVGAQADAGATTAVGGAHGTIDLTFSEVGGFVLDFVAEAHDYYDDLQPVMRWALAAAKNGHWEPSWVLITERISSLRSVRWVSGASRSRRMFILTRPTAERS